MDVSKIPGPQTGITDMVDHLLDKEDVSFNAFPLRPSAAGKCERALAHDTEVYLGLKDYPEEERAPNVKRLLSLGHSIEFHLLRVFRMLTDANPDVRVTHKQQSVDIMQLPDGKWISGSIDFAITWGKELGIGDVKSAKDAFSQAHKTRWEETLEKFNELESLERIGEYAYYAPDLEAFLSEYWEPFPSLKQNLYQLNLYCTTDWAKRHNTTFGSIIKYNKNSSHYYELRFAPSDALADKVKEKFLRIYKAVQEGEIETKTEKEYTLGSGSCAFCRYKTVCWPNATRKDHYKNLPPKKWPTYLDRLQNADKIGELFAAYEDLEKQDVKKKEIHDEIVRLLEAQGETKVELDNKHVYDVKQYKTGGVGGGPRLALKRGKK